MRGIREQEIEEIARMQMEPRENIIRFLLAEGSLSNHRGFAHRVSALATVHKRKKRIENLNLRKLVLHSDIILEYLITPVPIISVMRRVMRKY